MDLNSEVWFIWIHTSDICSKRWSTALMAALLRRLVQQNKPSPLHKSPLQVSQLHLLPATTQRATNLASGEASWLRLPQDVCDGPWHWSHSLLKWYSDLNDHPTPAVKQGSVAAAQPSELTVGSEHGKRFVRVHVLLDWRFRDEI